MCVRMFKGIPIPKLKKRQKQVLDLLVKGKTTKEIGLELFISPKTVEIHRRDLFYNLGAENGIEAAYNACKMNLI